MSALEVKVMADIIAGIAEQINLLAFKLISINDII